MPATKRKGKYLQRSREWPFRLYTRKEVLELLRISDQTFYKLRKEGILTPLVRRDGKRCPRMKGLTFYSDYEVYKAIRYLFREMGQDQLDAIHRQLFTVRENDYRVSPWAKTSFLEAE